MSESLEERVTVIEEWKSAIEKQTVAIQNMVELFERIENSLWLFVKMGNALKWLAGLTLSFFAAWAAMKAWLGGHSI